MQGNDGANTSAARLGRGVVTVVPVTSNTERVYPFQVLLDAADPGRDGSGRPGGTLDAASPRRSPPGPSPPGEGK